MYKASQPGKNKPEKLFYGWYVVLIAFLGNFMGTGTSFYIFNAFMEPLCSSRGWTRTDINIAPLLGWAVSLLSTPFLGTIIIRFGPRILMTLGAIVSAITFILLGLWDDLWVFYFLFMLLFLSNRSMSGIVTNTVVNNWFIKKRGKALGLATSGISLSGAILPYSAMIILEKGGLFQAFLWIGVAVLIVAPLSWYIVKNRPEDLDLLPDGEVLEKKGEKTNPDKNYLSSSNKNVEVKTENENHESTLIWTPVMLFREKTFWQVGLSYGLVMMGVMGVMFQLKPHFANIGFDGKSAMAMMAATAVLGTIGKYIWGWLCDFFPPLKIIAVMIIFNIIGLGFEFFSNSIIFIILFIIIFGFSMGGVISTFPVIIAYLFGRNSYAHVARFAGFLLGINSIGFLIMGQSFDRTGSYTAAYAVFIFLDIIALLLVLSIKKPGTKDIS